MIVLPIQLRSKRFSVKTKAVLDTGYEGGLYVATSLAEEAGATLVRPRRLPRSVTGERIRGSASILVVYIPEAKVSAETLVFCPDEDPNDALLGIQFLAAVGAEVSLGTKQYGFRKTNPAKLDVHDLSWMVIPTRRPMTKWW